ncbi:hypothetical protein [Streptomyces sp. H39-S7]|uniref:hypothetical protein n=1 Tax=Streptomyces sp. H39-S7 TaxID=3004357 RepID=UPI0022AF79E5|nr:hypothetical protein [Streptomyces sp. H39-S7]MCZ4124621.1 hypothetical protein [Streptomyces sp. H39-S7]
MSRMNRVVTILTGASAALSLATTPGAATASPAAAPSVPVARTAQVAVDSPFFLWATYHSEIECSQTGHNLVNRGPYASYMCSRVLGGWQLWVRRY